MIKPPAEKSLSSLTFIYVVGNFASKAISFVLVFVITFYLSREAVGEYDLIFSTLALLTPFLNLQLNDAILRWLLEEKNNDTISKVWTSSFVIVTLVVVCFTPIYFLICLWLNIQYYTIIYFLIVVTTFLPLFQMMARGMEHSFTFVLSGIIYSFVFTALSILSLTILSMQIEGLLIAAFIANFSAVFYIEYKIKSRGYFKKNTFDKTIAKELFKFSVPLLPNTLSWWAISTANRYIILVILGVAANGVFAISFKIPTLLLMITSFFNMAWQEKAIKKYNDVDHNEYYSIILEKYLRILLSIVLVLVAINKTLLGYIVSDSFFDAWKYTPILLISVIFQSLSSFYGIGYLCSKNTKGAFTTSIYGGMTTILCSVILIPIFNLFGASISIALGYFVMFITRIFFTKKYINIIFPIKTFLFISFLIICCLIISISDNFLINIFNFTGSLLLFIFLNKNYCKIMFVRLVQLRNVIVFKRG